MALKIIISVLTGYLVGSIPWALVIGKVFYHTDVRSYGSGNLGATNAGRVLGTKVFFIVAVLDALKGLMVFLLVQQFDYHMALFAAAGVFIGHCYPLFSNFKGGKGVATCFGVVAAIGASSLHDFLIQFVLPVALLFAIVLISKYMSLASITTLPLAAVINCLHLVTNSDLATNVTLCILAGLVVLKHHENIKRLINHQENKFEFKRKK